MDMQLSVCMLGRVMCELFSFSFSAKNISSVGKSAIGLFLVVDSLNFVGIYHVTYHIQKEYIYVLTLCCRRGASGVTPYIFGAQLFFGPDLRDMLLSNSSQMMDTYYAGNRMKISRSYSEIYISG